MALFNTKGKQTIYQRIKQEKFVLAKRQVGKVLRLFQGLSFLHGKIAISEEVLQ